MSKSDDHLPCFLDFEASSLRDSSYPIEVAWSTEDGSIENHLISPVGISGWTDWSESAERVHGIAREELIKHGQSPAWVARRMNEQLMGRTVYVDATYNDGMWLNRLFEQYGSGPQFELRHAEEGLLIPLIVPEVADLTAAYQRLSGLKPVARRRCGDRHHRASDDVCYLVELWKIVTVSTL